MRNYVQIIVLTAVIFSCADNQYIKMREIVIASVVSPDSPMYGCESCREVLQYRYSDGRLVKSDSTSVK